MPAAVKINRIHNDDEVLGIIKKLGKVTRADIAWELEISENGAGYWLNKLKENHRIKECGIRRIGTYSKQMAYMIKETPKPYRWHDYH